MEAAASQSQPAVGKSPGSGLYMLRLGTTNPHLVKTGALRSEYPVKALLSLILGLIKIDNSQMITQGSEKEKRRERELGGNEQRAEIRGEEQESESRREAR